MNVCARPTGKSDAARVVSAATAACVRSISGLSCRLSNTKRKPGVTKSSWNQFQKASHRLLARRDLKASIGFTVSSFHHVPGNFNRS